MAALGTSFSVQRGDYHTKPPTRVSFFGWWLKHFILIVYGMLVQIRIANNNTDVLLLILHYLYYNTTVLWWNSLGAQTGVDRDTSIGPCGSSQQRTYPPISDASKLGPEHRGQWWWVPRITLRCVSAPATNEYILLLCCYLELLCPEIITCPCASYKSVLSVCVVHKGAST